MRTESVEFRGHRRFFGILQEAIFIHADVGWRLLNQLSCM